MEILQAVTSLKEQLDEKRPLPSETVKSLQEDFLIKNTYHSNAIEGNTLTVYETKAILEDGITVGGKSLREHLEVINHREAIQYVETVVSSPLTERMIRDIHQLILRGIDPSNAGIYRKQEVVITGATYHPTSFWNIPEEMNQLMTWYQQAVAASDMHPVEMASILHSTFVNIHPFIDGNGRTARLLMNMELMRNGYLPVIIQVEQRQDYYEALDHAAVTKGYTKLIEMVAKQEQQALQAYLRLI